MRKKNVIIMIISILAFISIVGGVSYSYFIYNKDIVDVSVDTGNMSLSFNNASSSINNISMVPLSYNLGKISNKYIDFTVNGTVDTERIYYEVYIVPKNDSTLSQDNVNNYVKTYLTDQNDVQINNIKLYKNLRASYKNNGKVLYQTIVEPNSNGTQKSETKNFRLRLWIDEGYQSTQEGTFNFSIYLYAMNVDDNFTIPLGGGVEKVKNAINAKINATTNACTPTWTDNNDTPDDESDDVIYFSGTNDCVDMNYVWYSGKLWRITAIYSDGAMKLVTQNNITSIAFNASNQVNFYTDENTTSYMYQWLNEDFYDTLYNASEFIDTTKKWNATMPADTNISTKPAETNMVSANVGLLNSYEYYNSYRCISSAACTGSSSLAGYLNIMYYWWLLNPYDTSNV